MNLNLLWIILFVISAIYYLYVGKVLLFKKKSKINKNEKNDDILQKNTKFVNNSLNEQSDLETILSQVDEVENNSKLLEAFKTGSESEDLNKSLTRKKDKKFKVIRNKDSADKKDSDSGT